MKTKLIVLHLLICMALTGGLLNPIDTFAKSEDPFVVSFRIFEKMKSSYGVLYAGHTQMVHCENEFNPFEKMVSDNKLMEYIDKAIKKEKVRKKDHDLVKVYVLLLCHGLRDGARLQMGFIDRTFQNSDMNLCDLFFEAGLELMKKLSN